MEENELVIMSDEEIKKLIYTIRGKQVMLGGDIARLYKVETKQLNQAVKRNEKRFPKEFCFQLTNEESRKRSTCKIFTVCVYRTGSSNVICCIIDNKELYHCGASLKDLGKKCFGINRIEDVKYIESLLRAANI